MPFGSQSNQAPGLPSASPACPEGLPAGSSAVCFHPAAAAKIPVSLRFPAQRQPPARPGPSIPAPHQKKLRAARARCPRRPVPLRARSDKQPARRSAASGPPRKQNRDPELRPHPAAVPCTPAKPLSPGLLPVLQCAPRNNPFPFDCSKFFLGDHDSGSGPFIRGKFGGDRKAASPYKNAATRQHRPAVTLPPADALLVQQALQLVGASVTLGTQPVSGTPIAQHHWKTQPVPVQDRPIPSSFPSLGRPVNHPEAEYAPQFRSAHLRLASRQIDLVLIFLRRVLRSSHSRIFDGLKYKRVSLSSYLYSARKSERTPVLSTARQLQHRVHMPRPQLTLARLDAFHDPADHPLAQWFCVLCLLCALRVLRVKFVSFPRMEQIVDGDSPSFTALLNQHTRPLLRDGVQKGLILSCELGERCEMFNDCRLKLFLEQGQELLPNPRAHPLRVAVGEIFTPGLFSSPQKTAELISAKAQQRADDRTGHGMNSA